MKRSENTFLLHGKPIREHILKLAENSNKEFAEKLNPGVENVLGLRLPDLRKLANALWTCVRLYQTGREY